MNNKLLMTDEQKIKRVIGHLTCGHLKAFGGYPHDWVRDGNNFHIASLDDGKERRMTRIDSYTKDQLIDWHDEAVDWIRTELSEEDDILKTDMQEAFNWDGEDWFDMPGIWTDALCDTQPEPKVLRHFL